MNKNLVIILLLPKIKSLLLSFRAKMKPIISHYYSHTNIEYRSTTWSRSSIFSECDCPCFHCSVNLDQCQTISILFFFKIDPSCNFILKLVKMFPLLNTDYRVDLPTFILIPSYPIIADKGLE